jgi:hypothetical protein
VVVCSVSDVRVKGEKGKPRKKKTQKVSVALGVCEEQFGSNWDFVFGG